MLVEVVMPKMGESIQEGKVLRWTKAVGEKIQKDETILEISTDKVDSEIPSPVGGILAKIVAAEQEVVPVGAVIAFIETDMNASIDVRSMDILAQASSGQASLAPAASVRPHKEAAASPARASGNRFLSPLVRSIAQKEGVSESEFSRMTGSGANGRVTKEDLLKYLQNRSIAPVHSAAASHSISVQRLKTADVSKKYPAPGFRVVPMENVQVKMAEHMLRSVATSPHVAAIDEVDVTMIVNARSRLAADFETREGFKLTFTPFFADAVVQALKKFPIINSSVEGDHIIYKNAIHLGIAVASPTGLLVPNVRHAEEKNFVGLARAINDLAVRTRAKKLTPDDISGGTFSITNYGVFGNIIGTPIINQPQVAILGIGAVKKRPMVATDAEGNDTVAIRSMVYLTLAFDHRIIDGAIGGQFLARVKQQLEEFDLNGIA